jgi:hypothetical protein
MKLRLHVTKKRTRDFLKPPHMRFAVVDLDISKEYPKNFVCILPVKVNPKASKPTKFHKKFKDQSQELIKKLLKQTLRKTDDQDIKKEIRKRLKRLKTNSATKRKCKDCGKLIEISKRRYGRHKLCQECYRKKYSIT